MKFEYAISRGPGTLIAHGQIDASCTAAVDDEYGLTKVNKHWIEDAIGAGCTVLIGPVSYEGSGETIKLVGDE